MDIYTESSISSSADRGYVSKFDVTYDDLMSYAGSLALTMTGPIKVDGKYLVAEVGTLGNDLYVFADRAINRYSTARKLVLRFQERIRARQVAVYTEDALIPEIHLGNEKLMDGRYTIFKSYLASEVAKWLNDERYRRRSAARTSLW